jgi:2-polyprenyl-6-hydroxyphenyl methylase/3-demethylubiquinone-9 3-methyltransferase
VYVGLAVFSTLFVTKDEAVHARLCTGGEHWLHALLFVLHPTVLAAYGLIWWSGGHPHVLALQLAVVVAFAAYQLVYWNLVRERRGRVIDNTWYRALGGRWYDADDTPIALLRAEARHRNPWIAGEIARANGPRPCRVLDVGCGAGFLSNYLAARRHEVTGVDAEPETLAVAHAYDLGGRTHYVCADARALPFADASFDVVCAMDLLEHIEDPSGVIAEASRVLVPGGRFFFHTFNRTWLANLIVIHGVAWFVRDTPKDLHVLRLFITPGELAAMCAAHGLAVQELRGSRPRLGWPLYRMLLTGRVGADFEFTSARSLRLGYTGCATRLLASTG